MALDTTMSEITRLLDAADPDGSESAEEYLSLVYDELRRLAARRMAAEPPGQTLQATALVHEAWIRLTAGREQSWSNRAYFFAAAAEAMRRILIERARRKISARQAGFAEQEELSESRIMVNAAPEDLLAVHEALELLEREDPEAAGLVKLRYFTGMSMTEAADALGLPVRSAERLWTFCKAFLKNSLARQSAGRH